VSGKRTGAPVDDLANTGEEVLTDVGDHAADDDHRRVEQIDAARGDTADVPARLTHRMHSRGVPRTHQVDELGSALDLIALLAQRLHHGVPAGQRFEAALITASARNGPAAGYRDVTEVARSAVVTAPQLAIADAARAGPGGDFDEDQILNVRPACRVLTERHDVHVIVHPDRHIHGALHVGGNVETVPSRLDRRRHRAARAV